MGSDALKASAWWDAGNVCPAGSLPRVDFAFVRSRMHTVGRPSAASCGPSGHTSTDSGIRVGSQGWPSSWHPPGDQGPVLGLSAIGNSLPETAVQS